MRLDLKDTTAALRERRGTRRKRRRFDPTGVPLESQEQASLVEWAWALERQIPELKNLFAIPNQGAARLKRLQMEGTKRGVPDLFLAVPRGRDDPDQAPRLYSGLFIEMKRVKGGKISADQYEWHERLTNQGYKCVVARGYAEARAAILEYLGKA